MTPAEWWRIYELERPKDPKTDYAGTLTRADVERLEGMMNNGNRRSR